MEPIASASIVVLIGIAIGLAAKPFSRGRAPEVFVALTVLGLSGAVSATLLGVALDWHLGGLSGPLVAAAGAIALVATYRVASERLGS